MLPRPAASLLLVALALSGCAEKRAEFYIERLAHPDSQVRLEASRTLIQLGDASVDPLVRRAAGGSDSLLYIAAQILGQIGDRRATPFLQNLLQTPNPHVRERAVRALGQLADRELSPTLVEVLKGDPATQVRAAAAWSLGNLRDTTAVAPLVRALADTSSSVRQQTLTALHYLWTPEAARAAISALLDPDETVRYIAAQMLGKHRESQGLQALREALVDPSAWVRAEAARALGQLGDTAAVPDLETLLRWSEGPDQEAARQALLELTGQDYVVVP